MTMRLGVRSMLAGLAVLLLAVAGVTAAAGGAGADAGASSLTGETGILTAVHPDLRLGDAPVEYYLKQPGGWLRLHLAAKPSIAPGTLVRVVGTRTARGVDVAVSGGALVAIGPAPAAAAVTGTRQLLVILVRWGTATLNATRALATAQLFGPDTRSTASWYRDDSYGAMTWAGTVTPVLTIADPGTCDTYGIATAADAAAQAAGYTLANYPNRMIDYPGTYCAARGYGEVGGTYTWIENGLANLADGYERLLPAHELGHNLGLWHSHGLECGAVTISAACLATSASNEEYGAAYDIMGNNWPGDAVDGVAGFSAKQLIQLGWFAGRDRAVTVTGDYVIDPIETTAHPDAQALIITTTNHQYVVEYRRPLVQDAFLASFPQATNGVQVFMRDDLPGADTGPMALDMAPNSDVSTLYSDWFDASLDVGQTYTDVDSQFTLTTLSAATGSASVRVTFAARPVAPTALVATGGASGNTLSWLASSGTGITGYNAYRATAATGPWTRINAVPLTTTTYLDGAATQGTASYYQVSAIGSGGAESLPVTASVVRPFLYQETSAVVTGTWLSSSCACFSGGKTRYATAANASASFTFTGTKVQFLSERASTRGSFKIYLDGTLRTTVSNNAATTQNAVVVWLKGFTTSGTHTIKIVVVGTAGHPRVDVDAFTVTP